MQEADSQLLAADLLPDWDDDWVLMEQEQHRQVRLHALERLSDAHLSAGRYDAALQAGLAAVAAEPLRESAHRTVIAVHLAEENAAEALRQFDAYRRLLHRELGLSPSGTMHSQVGHLLGRTERVRSRPKVPPTRARSPRPAVVVAHSRGRLPRS